MDEFINVSHVFISDISKYMYLATFCDLKNRTKVLLYFSVFYLSIDLDSS